MLSDCIRQCKGDVEIVASLEGVADTVAWLEAHGQPDLLFLDIQLSDGTSFDIFRRSPQPTMTMSWRRFSPMGSTIFLSRFAAKRLPATALEKYERLKGHFVSDQAAIWCALTKPPVPRERFLVPLAAPRSP
jgi:two-component system, LytTR family, response regulator LytT